MKNKLISAVILLVIACTCVFGFAACQITQTPYHEHEYETTVIAPTCEAQGYTHYACKGCDDEYDADYVEAKGHNIVDEVCTDCDYVTNVKLFGDAFKKLPSLTGYNYVGWITDKEEDAGYLMNDVADFTEIYDAYYAKMTEEELARLQSDATINANDLSAYTTLMLKQKAVEAVNLEGVENLTVYENIYYTTGSNTKEMTAKEALYQLDELICRVQAGSTFTWGTEADNDNTTNYAKVMDFDNTAFQSVRIVVLREYLENAGVTLPEYFDAIFSEIGYDAFYTSYQAIYETVRLTATYAKDGKTVADMTDEDKASFVKYWGGGYDLSQDAFLNWNWNSGNKFETYYTERVAAIALQYYLESGNKVEERFIAPTTVEWKYGDRMAEYEYKGVKYIAHVYEDEAEALNRTYGSLIKDYWDATPIYIDADGNICTADTEGATMLTTSTPGVTKTDRADWGENCAGLATKQYKTADGQIVYKRYVWSASGSYIDYDATDFVDEYNRTVDLSEEEIANITVVGVVKVYKYFDEMAAWLKPQDYVVNANGWGAKYVELSQSAKKVIDIFEKTTFNGASFDAFDEMMTEYNKISEDEKALIAQTYTNFNDTVELLDGHKNALEAVDLEGVKDVTVYENIYYTTGANTKTMTAKDALYQLNNLICRIQAGTTFTWGTEADNDNATYHTTVMNFDNTAFQSVRIVVLRQYLENAGVTLPEYFDAIFTEIGYDNFYDAYDSIYQTVKLAVTYAKDGKTVADMTEEDKAAFEKYWVSDYEINATLKWNWNDPQGKKFEANYTERVAAIALQYYLESGSKIEERFIEPTTVEWKYGQLLGQYSYKDNLYWAYIYEDEAKEDGRVFGALSPFTAKDDCFWKYAPAYIDANGNICDKDAEGATMLTTSIEGVEKTEMANWAENCAGLATKQYKTADGQIVYKRYVWRNEANGGSYIDYDATDFVDEYNRTVTLSEEELAKVTMVGPVKVYKYFDEMIKWLEPQGYTANSNGWGVKPVTLTEDGQTFATEFKKLPSLSKYNYVGWATDSEEDAGYLMNDVADFAAIYNQYYKSLAQSDIDGLQYFIDMTEFNLYLDLMNKTNGYFAEGFKVNAKEYGSSTAFKDYTGEDMYAEIAFYLNKILGGVKYGGSEPENDDPTDPRTKQLDSDNNWFPSYHVLYLKARLEENGYKLPTYLTNLLEKCGEANGFTEDWNYIDTVLTLAAGIENGTITTVDAEVAAKVNAYMVGKTAFKEGGLSWNFNASNSVDFLYRSKAYKAYYGLDKDLSVYIAEVQNFLAEKANAEVDGIGIKAEVSAQ